jgi:Putative lumazine-binding
MVAAALALLLAGCNKAASGGADPDVTAFLHRYFDTWSAQDMQGYADCFDDAARIYYVAADERIVAEAKPDFIHGQKLAHQQATVPMKEVPVTMTVQGDEKIKQAAVTWVLTKGQTEERGTDFFTLRRLGGAWKIVSLTFYGQ